MQTVVQQNTIITSNRALRRHFLKLSMSVRLNRKKKVLKIIPKEIIVRETKQGIMKLC